MIDSFIYSVIIPYRDKFEMLHKAVESIPDRDNIQIIIVDNNNVPFREDIASLKTNASIEYYTSDPTKGAGCARNEGLKYVKGQFILFLDSDDYFTDVAFEEFDKYSQYNFDIVYYMADSVKLSNGERSTRHKTIEKNIQSYLDTGNEDFLRFRFANPVCKLFRADLVLNNGIQFEEVKVSNDVMFSLKTGHLAKTITASPVAVYMITEAEKGVSLTTDTSAENSFIRYQVAIRMYHYLKSIGRRDIRPRFSSYILSALRYYGVGEMWKYVVYYYKNKP